MLVKVLRYLLLVRFKIDIVEEIFRRIGFMDRSKLGRLISAAAFLITIQGCGGPIKQEFPVRANALRRCAASLQGSKKMYCEASVHAVILHETRWRSAKPRTYDELPGFW